MSEKKTMQFARSNCSMTCSRCNNQFKAKYGIMDGEVFCPKCYNMYVEKNLADISDIRDIRRNRTILRLICFAISVTAIVLSIVLKSDDNTFIFALLLVAGILIGIFPFYKDFLAFVSKGFSGFVRQESTVKRNTVIYYRNGIIEDGNKGFMRFLCYLVDFILVWPCLALLYICVIPRAIIDLVRIGKAKKKIDKGFDTLLPPVEGLNSDKYNFKLRFISSYDDICINFYMKWKKVKENDAIEALEKNLIFSFEDSIAYKEGYKHFLKYYYGRRAYDGKRYVYLDVEPIDNSNPLYLSNSSKKRKNK